MIEIRSIIIILTFLLISCNEENLNVERKGDLSEQEFYKTEEHAIKALSSAYDPLTWPEFYSVTYFLIYDGGSDDCITENAKFSNFAYTADDSDIRDFWNILYMGIYRCNLVLEKINYSLPIKPELIDRMHGEAYFLRALYNWHLVTSFGEAPLIKRVLSVEELKQPKASKQDFWVQIESDLLEAEQYLPITYLDNETGRATKGAAQSLLGKAYLYQHNWEKAAVYFEKVINSGVYELIQPNTLDSSIISKAFLSVFSEKPILGFGGDNNSESVFEVQFNEFIADFNGGPYLGWGNAGTNRDVYLNSEPLGLGYDNLLPNPSFISSFEPSDPRLGASVWLEGHILDERPGQIYYNHTYNPEYASPQYGSNIKKTLYPIWYSREVSPTNWRVIRYADVILMYAEALYHLKEDAYPYINMVRARVGLPATEEPMPRALIHERRHELAFEGHRLKDLIRWSHPDIGWVHIPDLIPSFTVNKHEHLPIPQFEIDVSEGVLTQNPNY